MKYLIPLLIYLNLSIYAQIKDDFSSQKLQNWQGDTNMFVVENQTLKSFGPNTANQTFSITRPNSLFDDAEWYISVDLKFNPTTSNLIRIYLCSDQQDLSKGLNGYFIQFGESNADTLDFFRQQGTQTIKLFTGKTAFSNNLKCDIKVARTQQNDWTFYTRSGTNSMYTLEGSVNDIADYGSQYFGLWCQYATASRYNQFCFDNLEIIKTKSDTAPPRVIKSSYLQEQSFIIHFNEAIRDLKIQSLDFETATYSYTSSDSSSIEVRTKNPLILGKAVLFEILTVADKYGNMATGQKHGVICPRNPVLHDLVFTELMVDESPSQGLPEHEYIEIYTLSKDFISCKNCYLTDGFKKFAFPDSILVPNQYYLLCKKSDATDFDFAKNKILFPTLPTLTNSGKTLKIVHDSTLICEVTYTDKWYQGSSKIEGGWSLEALDLDNFCEEYYNWKPSVSTLGGTPSISNSVQKEIFDTITPSLLNIDVQSDTSIHLKFNKRLETYTDYSQFINLPNQQVKGITAGVSSYDMLYITLLKPDSSLYSLNLRIHNLKDCYGNILELDTTFNLPSKVLSSQLLINEVLFDAPIHGAEYVELYNASHKPLNLKGLFLSKRRNDTLYTSRSICNKDIWVNGKELIVLTELKEAIRGNYPDAIDGRVYQLDSWPQFPDDSGTVILHNDQGEIIDFFPYHEKLHNPLIQNTEGVALEKIIPGSISNKGTLWKSAAEALGFGTPTQPNSQLAYVSTHFSIYPKVISPDGDGRDDYCTIRPRQEAEADLVNIRIIDGEGRLVKTIAQNSNIGSNSFFTWDGTLDNLTKAAWGPYIVHIEHYGVGKDRKVERYSIGVFN